MSPRRTCILDLGVAAMVSSSSAVTGYRETLGTILTPSSVRSTRKSDQNL